MKWAVLSIVTLLLGAALGWRGDAEPETGAVLDKGEPAAVVDSAPVDPGAGEAWRSWAERIGAASSGEELEQIFAEVAVVEDAKLKWTLERLLGRRWAEVDPHAGLAFLQNGSDRKVVLREMLIAWGARDADGAVETLVELAGEKGSGFDSLVRGLMSGAPDAAFAVMQKAGRYPGFTNWKTRDAFVSGLSDPEAFAAWIVEIETARLERGARVIGFEYFKAIGRVLVERDPAAALEWSNSLDGKMRNSARPAVVERWSEIDPAAVVAHMTATGEMSKNSVVVKRIVEAFMKAGELDSAARWVEAKGWAGVDFAEQMASQLGSGAVEVSAAYELMSGMETYEDRVRDDILRDVWSQLPPEAFEGAFATVADSPEGSARPVAMGGLLRQWVRRDPAAAMTALSQVAPGGEREQVVMTMFEGAEEIDQGQFAESAMAALPAVDRPAAVVAMFEGLDPSDASISSTKAIAQLLSEAPPSEARAAAVGQVAVSLGAMDPDGALAWAESLSGEDMELAFEGAARGWAEIDQLSLSHYLLEMPEGRARDRATGALVENLASSESDSAWLWTAEMLDADLRLQARSQVIEHWAESDRVAAQAAIEAADIPANEREALRAVMLR